MGMQFKQKQGLCRAFFDFGEEELTYSFDNSRVKAGGAVPYHKIPNRAAFREIKMWWFRYVAVFVVTAWVLAALHFLRMNDVADLIVVSYAAVLFLLCALLIALLRRNRRVTHIVLEPSDPILYVLHDGQQNAILDEIAKRRLEMMRRKFGQVDFNRPYFEEAAKFKWLKEQGVISEQECRHARQQIAAMREKTAMLRPEPGPARFN
jgi:hypothetical protein